MNQNWQVRPLGCYILGALPSKPEQTFQIQPHGGNLRHESDSHGGQGTLAQGTNAEVAPLDAIGDQVRQRFGKGVDALVPNRSIQERPQADKGNAGIYGPLPRTVWRSTGTYQRLGLPRELDPAGLPRRSGPSPMREFGVARWFPVLGRGGFEQSQFYFGTTDVGQPA